MRQQCAALWRWLDAERANRGGQPTQPGGAKVETGNSQKQPRATKDTSAAPATMCAWTVLGRTIVCKPINLDS